VRLHGCVLQCTLTCTGATGLYLALTGSRLKTPEDLLYAGLGTHFVPSGQLPALREALAKPLKRQPDKQHGMQQILERLQPYAQEVNLPGRLQTCDPVLFQVGCDSIAWHVACVTALSFDTGHCLEHLAVPVNSGILHEGVKQLRK